ncbi:MAG: phosphoribosylformylglycinamidine synthase subunit PurL [Fimbriimonadaceae bacterium]|nr:phosphoribosylformylglycinamidine synthase subunit PurL [Fimbriimonadaceae bacterium]QYK54993.1 MAG: phosphoribosylformylglycinamidine synthase subunit PurL [Fimbriimonadaceae bacterium]
MPTISPDTYRSMGLTTEEYETILRLLGREPTQTELGMFSVQWSEHCSYKSSRSVLSRFKRYREAIEGDGLENAGVIDVGDGLGIVMKVESHNHPSAVEPYQGAATGVGGIIRDILTMGARPIASLNSLRFGPIREGMTDDPTVARNRYLFERVVAGIGGYGNCVGVPTVGGEVDFHPGYSGNPLVNAMSVGVVRLDAVTTAAAGGVGNPVLYLGSATGRDGIHGASFASENLGEDSEAKRPNVQIGDPFAEKLLIEATLEALATGAVQSIQDMGAAGLTCSTTEMSSKGQVGMEIDLDLVPMREPDMTAYELMLSESQERMLCVAYKGREHDVVEVFQKWGLNAVVIGTVTEGDAVRVYRNGRLEASAPAAAFTDGCPARSLSGSAPEWFEQAKAFDAGALPDVDLTVSLKRLLSSQTVASKRWVFQQYDQEVQTQTKTGPGRGDAAVLALRGTKRGIAVTIDGNSRWVALDPYVGGLLAVCEAARNVACVGARPVGVTDGLNYGDPGDPEVFWQLDESVRGIAEACEAFATPVVSGNVSLYNKSDLGAIPPTPMIGMLGLLEDVDHSVRMGIRPGSRVGLLWYPVPLGPGQGLGASLFLSVCHGLAMGVPVPPDIAMERQLCDVCARLAEEKAVSSLHDVSDGGLLVALVESALAGGSGLDLQIPSAFLESRRLESTFFGEVPGLIVLSAGPENVEKIEAAVPQGLNLAWIGNAVEPEAGLAFNLENGLRVELSYGEARGLYEDSLSRIMDDQG